jgi:hypothetical protein
MVLIYLLVIQIAKQSYPLANFYAMNFLTFTPSQLIQQQQNIHTTNTTNTNVVTTIVFHECFQYFANSSLAFQHAQKFFLSSSPTATATVTSTSSSMVDDKATTTIAITQRKKKQERIIISHPKGYQNVMIQHQHNPWLVPSLLPTPEQISTTIANETYRHTSD